MKWDLCWHYRRDATDGKGIHLAGPGNAPSFFTLPSRIYPNTHRARLDLPKCIGCLTTDCAILRPHRKVVPRPLWPFRGALVAISRDRNRFRNWVRVRVRDLWTSTEFSNQAATMQKKNTHSGTRNRTNNSIKQ